MRWCFRDPRSDSRSVPRRVEPGVQISNNGHASFMWTLLRKVPLVGLFYCRRESRLNHVAASPPFSCSQGLALTEATTLLRSLTFRYEFEIKIKNNLI